MIHILDQSKNIWTQINPKLRRRLQIYMMILVILTGLSIYQLITYGLNLWWVLWWLLMGWALGLFAGRMFKISRHPETEKVISTMDRTWGIFLAIYIGIEVSRKWIFGHWIQWTELQVFTYIFLTGIFMGRLLTMITTIKAVLITQNKLSA
jgi:hypothetical protein